MEPLLIMVVVYVANILLQQARKKRSTGKQNPEKEQPADRIRGERGKQWDAVTTAAPSEQNRGPASGQASGEADRQPKTAESPPKTAESRPKTAEDPPLPLSTASKKGRPLSLEGETPTRGAGPGTSRQRRQGERQRRAPRGRGGADQPVQGSIQPPMQPSETMQPVIESRLRLTIPAAQEETAQVVAAALRQEPALSDGSKPETGIARRNAVRVPGKSKRDLVQGMVWSQILGQPKGRLLLHGGTSRQMRATKR